MERNREKSGLAKGSPRWFETSQGEGDEVRVFKLYTESRGLQIAHSLSPFLVASAKGVKASHSDYENRRGMKIPGWFFARVAHTVLCIAVSSRKSAVEYCDIALRTVRKGWVESQRSWKGLGNRVRSRLASSSMDVPRVIRWRRVHIPQR